MSRLKKNIFLGIDQTGAIDAKGKPRPLAACLIRKKSVTFLYLATFSKEEILKKVKLSESESLLICVDCVLGLPKELNLTWRSALKKIRKTKHFGRRAAIDFFGKIGKGQIFRREIEILCHANSVFAEKPYQKNIQTGTFRIWKDISMHEKDFYAPALENKISSGQIAIYEGYPSFSWRLLFGSKTRQPKNLTKFIKSEKLLLHWTRKHQSSVEVDPNLADAFLLALTMKNFNKPVLKMKPQNEGWILGFEHPNSDLSMLT